MADKKTKRVTAKDVAERAGVSRPLVSMYLSGNKNAWLSDETKGRIDEAVAALGYRPNTLARALRSGRSHTIGLLMGGISDPVGGLLAEIVMAEAEKRGFRLFVAVTRFDREKEREVFLNMLNYQMDGIIYTLSADYNDAFFRQFEHSACPVLLTENHPELPLDCVAFSLKTGLREAVLHFRKTAGCRSVLMYSGVHDLNPEIFRELTEETGCAFSTCDWPSVSRDPQLLMEKILQERPDLIVLGNGRIPLDTRSFPAGYSPRIICTSMLPLLDDAPDGLLYLPLQERLSAAVELLVDHIEHPEREAQKITIPSVFVPAGEARQLREQQASDPQFSALTSFYHVNSPKTYQP